MSRERARRGGSRSEGRGPSAGSVRLAAFALLVFPGATAASEAGNPPAEAVPLERRTVLSWQAALEAAGFSPGLLDGRNGPKTALATALFQAARGIPATGELCPDTARALGADPASAIETYAVSREDEALVDYCPPDWLERSRRRALLYPSLANLVAERFHTSERCLAELNPATDLSSLAPGFVVLVPRLRERAALPRGLELEIDLSRRAIILVDEAGAVRGLLHCSVPRDLDAVRRGAATVAVVVENPSYTFDPKMWPEVPDVRRKLLIPPGPRSPVGIRWIGLDRPGVGIHGTPEPENIGKTGSHGCFRLANWDAAYLAGLVTAGTRVRILDESPSLRRLPRD